ncbi:uncharacterized protein Z518_03924 [Rhinocladiella mackenziei CBS 650.93]|uniref:Zn(2)-C6 fungal-type domain-containing protein n=1 Tax=Rhinocladiella mackenziei CBS 650.93 TaxID=1442369 RepID=A0A0D2JA05_9EURO|nr:uncharacterized protein Z518_03924 [Rhinocladiella mackenziei CBS 650.93]KIX05950.1 hypothetical protein Z518_03924 [Rhinocladiella mackenziei CBS 650.93]
MERRHVTTACNACRENKTKCDGRKPSCEYCLKRRRTCQYSTKDDKRKVRLRAAVQILFDRVEVLTRLAMQHDLHIPNLSPGDQELLEDVQKTLDISQSASISLKSVATPVKQINEDLTKSGPNLDWHLTPPQESTILQTVEMSTSNTSRIPLQNNDTDLMELVPGQPLHAAFPGDDFIWAQFQSPSFSLDHPFDWPWEVQYDFSALTSDPCEMLFTSTEDSQLRQADHTEAAKSGRSRVVSNDNSEDEADTHFVIQLATRLGSLRVTSDGALRYYGSQSNHHLLGNSRMVEEPVEVRNIHRDGQRMLEKAGLGADVPNGLQENLIELFFKWHNPCHLTVDRNMFEFAQKGGKHGEREYAYNSQALVNAMCALGAAFEARYHHSFITFPKPLAEFFADRAKILLELELDSPCISTIQTLLLLSSHEAARGCDARMWLYSGMAMRLCFDIGLHVDSTPYVERGLMTPMEAEARLTTFWSSFVVNNLWYFDLGRPFRIDSEEISVGQPASLLDEKNSSWRPDSTLLHHYDETASSQRCHDRRLLILHQWVVLCEDVVPLIRKLYGCARISKTALQKLSFETTSRLFQWRKNSPEIEIDETERTISIEILMVYMAYHHFVILLHRPWTSKKSQPPEKIGPGFRHARSVCSESAMEVAKLLRLYEKFYGFRRMNVYAVNVIFSASLILIFHMINEPNSHSSSYEDDQITVDLNTCFRAMDELSQGFESAKRVRQSLFALQRQWTELLQDVTSNSKRRAGSPPWAVPPLSKRSAI